MLRHLVCLLDGVLQCALHSGELMAELGPDGWERLVELAGSVKELCVREGW